MKGSMEMKMQAIDEMLEMRKWLDSKQNSLGMYNGFHKDDEVLIYETEDFFEIAQHVKEPVKTTSKVTNKDLTSVAFSYNGVTFNAYISPGEYRIHKKEIDRGETDA